MYPCIACRILTLGAEVWKKNLMQPRPPVHVSETLININTAVMSHASSARRVNISLLMQVPGPYREAYELTGHLRGIQGQLAHKKMPAP